MKRFHVHMHVDDLPRNIAFYTALFDQPPARTEAGYAKWMLSDPPVNFAISTRGAATGIDHLGIQVDSPEELSALKARATNADMALLDEGETTCCYARSDKYWTTSPDGAKWELYRTFGDSATFGAGPSHEALAAAAKAPCCGNA